jgi:hypothetical protein
MLLLLLTAWLAAGLVIAWVIGKSSDLGKPTVARREVTLERLREAKGSAS